MKVGDLLIDESELVESFVRSSGPGGQNVNKVASAVELRFDARRSPSLPNEVATKLMKLAGSRLTQDGVIVIFAQRFSSQPRNREDASERPPAPIFKAARGHQGVKGQSGTGVAPRFRDSLPIPSPRLPAFCPG